MCDICYINGNFEYGTKEMHDKLRNRILGDLPKKYSVRIIESDSSSLDHLPDAMVYIGFSRGSRYLRRIMSNALKISIGGVKIHHGIYYRHQDDRTQFGDFSEKSINAHFSVDRDFESLIEDYFANDV